MIQIEIHWIWLLVILGNLIMTGFYLARDWRWSDYKVLYLIGYLLLGLLVPIGFLISLVWEILIEYVWKEIQFYYRFYLTNYYEGLVKKSTTTKDFLKGANELSAIWDKTYPDTFTQKRIKRHVDLINKRFNYDYKAVLAKEQLILEKEQEKLNKEIYKTRNYENN